ncbi:MAG: hypothetical protein GXP19_03070 [Gammaproteobacteria bacterium]|nr:hypothetical protein [Gammaproteobacteria bacterium]
MNEPVVSTRKPAIFLVASLAILFAPGIGDIRWVGLFTLLYIGLPWYILSVKDKIESKLPDEGYQKRRFQVHSLTLLLFGIICAVSGVAIDLFILHKVYTDPSVAGIGSAFFRLFIGAPFFGFGVYLIYLSLGRVSNET